MANLKKSEQQEIDNALDSIGAKKKAYRKYIKNESSSLLRRLAAESTREGIRHQKGILSKYKSNL